MGLYKIFFTMITLFSLTYCDDQLLSIELSLPDIMTAFTSIDQALRTLQGSDISASGAESLAENLMMKVKWTPFSYLAGPLLLLRRMNQMRPSVEMGPGSFKTEILKYPPNFFVSRLKTLIKIKEKEEERNKNLNARKENQIFLRIF